MDDCLSFAPILFSMDATKVGSIRTEPQTQKLASEVGAVTTWTTSAQEFEFLLLDRLQGYS